MNKKPSKQLIELLAYELRTGRANAQRALEWLEYRQRQQPNELDIRALVTLRKALDITGNKNKSR